MNFKNWPEIHKAVVDGDIERTKKLKEDMAKRHLLDPRGRSALQLASFLNEKKAALLLQQREPKKVKVELKNGTKLILFPQECDLILGFQYASSLKFDSLESLERVCDDLPWLFRHTFYGHSLKENGEKFDLEIDAGYVCDTVIKWRSEKIGYGLYAGVDLLPGSFIGEYTGQVRKIHRFKPNLNGYCFHYPTRFFSWHYTVIDSQKFGNETRFINHSDEPNLEIVWAIKNDLMHLIFLASRFIKKGEELTINYGEDYWRSRQKFM